MRALEGIVILDLSRYGPGRNCSLILADFGADVTTIETPRVGSDIPQFVTNDLAGRYLAQNRNKRSMTLNLKMEEGRNIFYRLAESADVILEGSRPGVARNLKVDYDTMKELNPRLVYCAITSYGQDGPYAQLPGHDINYLAISGIQGLTGYRDGPPVPVGTQIADLAASTHAAIAVLVALRAREQLGHGQYIDVSMTDGMVFWLWFHAFQYFLDGVSPGHGETLTGGSQPCYSAYQTRDGKYISLGCTEPLLWENICRALGWEDFIPYQHDTGKKRDEIFATFREIFATRTRDEWVDTLRRANVAISPVNSLAEAFSDPQVLHRKMVLEVEHSALGKIKQLGVPMKLSDTPGEVRSAAPRYGEHTLQILTDLGYTESEMEQLRQKGVIE